MGRLFLVVFIFAVAAAVGAALLFAALFIGVQYVSANQQGGYNFDLQQLYGLTLPTFNALKLAGSVLLGVFGGANIILGAVILVKYRRFIQRGLALMTGITAVLGGLFLVGIVAAFLGFYLEEPEGGKRSDDEPAPEWIVPEKHKND